MFRGLSSTNEYVYSNFAIALVSIIYFGLVGFVVTRAGSRELSFLRFPWLVKLGVISYGLYLYHFIIYEYLDTFFLFRWHTAHLYYVDFLKLLLSIILALASWHLIEKPILGLKDKFNYKVL